MAQLAALLKGVDGAAHAASTSFLNLLRAPTEGQARAGNYKKGRCTVAGLPLTIENAAGTRRKPEWAPLTAHYGYVRGTVGADGDQVDVFVRQGTPDDWTGPVFVVDQYHSDGSFDEHKCMVGWTDRSDAVRAYLGNYPRGWQLGPVALLSSAEFRAWIKSGDTSGPLVAKVAKLLKAYDPAMDLTARLLAILVELGHLRKAEWNEADHPRGEDGKFGDGGGGSANSRLAFHGTSVADLIEKEGFKIVGTERGRLLGDGIYLTQDRFTAEHYASESGGRVLEVGIGHLSIKEFPDTKTYTKFLMKSGLSVDNLGDPVKMREVMLAKGFDAVQVAKNFVVFAADKLSVVGPTKLEAAKWFVVMRQTASKVDLSTLLKGDVEGHPFYGNQWTEGAGGGEKPTKASAKGVKGGVHELLLSGHSFTFEELKAATGVTTDKHLSSALSELKNPKWAGPKGALTILKVGNHYYVQKADPNAGQQKPKAAPKPVAAAKPAAVEKPTGKGFAKAPAVKMATGAADKAYAHAVSSAAIVAAEIMNSGGIGATKAAQIFKDGKALAMAQWKANTTGTDQTAKVQEVFKADTKMMEALSAAAKVGGLTDDGVKDALAQWKTDTANEKAGLLGVVKPVVGTTHAIKPEVAASHAAAASATSSLSSAKSSTALSGIPSAKEIEASGGQVSTQDFDSTSSGGKFMKEVGELKSKMEAKTNGPIGNKVGVQKRISSQLKDSPNFEALATASNKTPEGLVKSLVSTWAGSSGDSNALSVAVQLAVRDVFDMKSGDLEMKALGTLKDHTEDEAYKAAANMLGVDTKGMKNIDGIKAGLREFVGAQYRSTQTWLKQQGIKHVSIFRGMRVGVGSAKPTMTDLKLQPASSFSTNLGTAKSFSGGRTVFMARVPASQVLGSYLTGFGCSNEHEVVLLAGPRMKAVAVGSSNASTRQQLGRLVAETLKPPVGKAVQLASLLKADAMLSPDADLINADWTKATWDLPPLNSTEFNELGIDKEKFMRTPAYLLAEEQGLVHDGEWVADWVTAAKPAGQVRLVPKDE